MLKQVNSSCLVTGSDLREGTESTEEQGDRLTAVVRGVWLADDIKLGGGCLRAAGRVISGVG